MMLTYNNFAFLCNYCFRTIMSCILENDVSDLFSNCIFNNILNIDINKVSNSSCLPKTFCTGCWDSQFMEGVKNCTEHIFGIEM
uniref:Uncharacterized protein n=1 Tax=viral metagenome TaxID=1070528 RepID=A0A6C0JUZ5_9ZZZZ